MTGFGVHSSIDNGNVHRHHCDSAECHSKPNNGCAVSYSYKSLGRIGREVSELSPVQSVEEMTGGLLGLVEEFPLSTQSMNPYTLKSL